MSLHFNPPLAAKRPGRLVTVAVCRISTVHQDALSLDDQLAQHKLNVTQQFTGDIEWIAICSRGSGQYLATKEILELTSHIESGRIDLVICEDLGRICRRFDALKICELCEDFGVRLVACNDAVDTFQPNWKFNAFFAALKHESFCADTAARICRTHRNRFSEGGVVQTTIPGIIKPSGNKIHDSQLRKDPVWEEVYDLWFTMLEQDASFSEVADMLNSRGLKTSRGNRWTCAAVARATRNPMLKGERRRNERKAKRTNSTGRSKSVKADPSELLTRYCPHLVFIEPERYDRVLLMLKARNAKFARKKVDGVDPRQNRTRKRTDWPGDHVVCGICGRPFVYGGNGQPAHLGCSGAKAYQCWNGTTFDAPLGGQKLIAAILEKVEHLPEFDDALMHNLVISFDAAQRDRADVVSKLDKQQKHLALQRDNLVDAIANSKAAQSLLAKLEEIEQELERLRLERLAAEMTVPDLGTDLPSIDRVKERARELLSGPLFSDRMFQRQLKILVPQIEVYPYRLLDCRKPVLRARVILNLAPLIWDAVRGLNLPVFRHEVVVDLFNPPQRELHRAHVGQRCESMSYKDIAKQLGITDTAAQRAGELHRLMQSAGRTDAYLPIREPSSELSRMRRHLHPRYRFEPLPGYEVPKFPTD